MKTFIITTPLGNVATIQASSFQKAANEFFGVEKAIRCMSPDGYWANHRHSKIKPNITAKIELLPCNEDQTSPSASGGLAPN